MYLRSFPPEFVVRLSLIRNWQGCVVTLRSPVVRFSTSSNPSLYRNIRSLLRNQHSFPILRSFHQTSIMGSSISRGRKFSPTKNASEQSQSALIGHAKFSCGDAPEQRTEYIQDVVCKESDLKDNEMKVFDLGTEGGKILLIKQKGKFSALGTKCTHYSAPLVNGYLGEGRIRCQWHGACFNTKTGDIEDFPGLDSLPCYEVKVSGGNVTVRAEKQLLLANKRVKVFSKTVQPTKATYIVVGGGAAGNVCVETLRQQAFDGRIIFVCAEKYLPYDRVKLTKSIDIDVHKILLRTPEFYQERNIEVMLSTELTILDPAKKLASFSNGQNMNYDKIFLATGATPRRLNIPGNDLQNILVIRNAEDAKLLKSSVDFSTNVVILGSSFIGMETAASCVDKVKSVTVIARKFPFATSFGKIIGNRILKLFEEKKVQFCLNATIEKFEGQDGRLTTVYLSDGTVLPADVCIVAVGIVSNSSYMKSCGAELQKNGAIEVNEYLQTKFPDVYAGGDVAFAPVMGQKANIGHWGFASYHGQIAACNMLDQSKSVKSIPFFWTMLFGKAFRYAGYAPFFNDVVIDGSIDDLSFIAFYCSDDIVLAVASINRDPLAAKFAEFLHEGKCLRKDQISEWLST